MHTEFSIIKFFEIRELCGNSATVWKELPEEREMVVTNNGRPVAILSAIGEADVEDCLRAIRQAKAVSAVSKLQSHSIEKGLDKLSDQEIEAEIAEVRLNPA